MDKLADELGVGQRKLDRDLYAGRSWTEFVPPRSDLPRLLLFWLLAVAFLAATGLALAVFAAALSAGPFKTAFTDIVNTYVLAVLLAPPIVAGFLALAGKGMSVEHSRSAPEAADEFERLFRGLMDEVKATKVVIFVDELDRCAADEVVGTLDALRTFLEVKRCIFIVAADRQVLEHALTSSLRQATPENTGNPYYSAGSSFIDKLFQYQLELPPLRTARLHAYAHELIAERPGIWQRFSDTWYVLSVLIPPHVKSPRRIKVLLNSFALSYRLLLRRTDQVAGIDERAAELAKLVCLRCEFPLFATDLYTDPGLPALVLLADEGELDEEIEEDRRYRARAYATGELPAAQLLVEGSSEAPGAQGATSAEPAPAVRRQHSLQLIRYLKETKAVPGPDRDLIHAQGLDSGLAPESREELVKLALEGDLEALEPALKRIRLQARKDSDQGASSKAEERERDALAVLAQTVRREDPQRRRNVIRALLAATETCARSLDDETADRAAAALLLHVSGLFDDLEPQERSPLLRLGLMTGRDVFTRCVLEQPGALEDPRVIEVALTRVSALLREQAEHAGHLWAAALLRPDSGIALDCIRGREPRETVVWSSDVEFPLAGPSDPALPRLSDEEAETLLSHALKPAREIVGGTRGEAMAEPQALSRMQHALSGIVDELEAVPAEAAALILLSITRDRAGDSLVTPPVAEVLERLAPLRYRPLADAVVAAAADHPLEEWPWIFRLLDAESFQPAERSRPDWSRLSVPLQEAALDLSGDDLASEVELAISALPSSLAKAVANSFDAVDDALGSPIDSAEQARQADALLSVLCALSSPADWDATLSWAQARAFERTAGLKRVDDEERVAAHLENLAAGLLEAEGGQRWARDARHAVEYSNWLPHSARERLRRLTDEAAAGAQHSSR